MCQQYIWAPCNLQITLSELNKDSIVLGNKNTHLTRYSRHTAWYATINIALITISNSIINKSFLFCLEDEGERPHIKATNKDGKIHPFQQAKVLLNGIL